MNIDIGLKLRELRMLRGMTQEELAGRAGLSKGFISQVERNLTSPSIATLTEILQCLDITPGEFFYEPPAEQIVFGKADYFSKHEADGKSTFQWLIPHSRKNKMEPLLLTLEAGGSTPLEEPHPGEEFGYMLQGTASLHLGSNTFPIRKGEAFYFTPDKQHWLSSQSGASFLWVRFPSDFS